MIFKEILNIEDRKTEEEFFKMHIFRENADNKEEGDENKKYWWRVYELSAYFACLFPNSLKENEKLKPSRLKYSGSENGIIKTGVPNFNSFQKYFPSLVINKDKADIEDNHWVIDVREYFKDKITFEDYKTKFKEWKESFECKETFSKQKTDGNVLGGDKATSTISIIQKILGYPLENKTPIETIFFVSELKKELSKIIK